MDKQTESALRKKFNMLKEFMAKFPDDVSEEKMERFEKWRLILYFGGKYTNK